MCGVYVFCVRYFIKNNHKNIYFSYAKKHLSKFLIATVYFIRNHGDNT
jgi:hypothetical protein